MGPIDSFTGEFEFLSNFYPSPVTYRHEEYPTVEHAYQAAKTNLPDERHKIRLCPTPGSAKRMGRKVTLRADWEKIKLQVMEELLRQKFSDPELRDKLMATGERDLIEDNTWNDTYWGECQGKGSNHLGRLLMKIRSQIRTTGSTTT